MADEQHKDWRITAIVEVCKHAPATLILLGLLVIAWQHLPATIQTANSAINAANKQSTELKSLGNTIERLTIEFKDSGSAIKSAMDTQNKILSRIEAGQERTRKDIVGELRAP